jgi:hypothetical protein
MKRMLLIGALVVCAFTIAIAQKKSVIKPFTGPVSSSGPIAPGAENGAVNAPPTIVRLDAQSQQEIAEAQRVANEARATLDAASAHYDAAQQKVITAVFKAMADAGLKPKEWAIKQDQNGIYFEGVKPVEAAAATSPGGKTLAPVPGKATTAAKPADTATHIPNNPN